MSCNNSLCEGARSAALASEFMAETFVGLVGEPMAPERKTAIREFMSRYNVGFTEEFDPRPDSLAYECLLDCGQCLGRVGLSLSCEVAVVQLASECPNGDNPIDIMTSAEIMKQLAE